MNRAILLIFVSLVSSGAYADNHEVSMACKWSLYGSQNESFVFNLKDKEVYWVNEDKKLKITTINEGLIVFEGTRSSLLVGDKKYKKNVKLTFKINRVTGELYIEGVKLPEGYNNICIATKKVI